jgi:hypothetical protein
MATTEEAASLTETAPETTEGQSLFTTRNVVIFAVVLAIILLLMWFLVGTEGMQDIFYLDYLVMKNPDPTRFKYTGRSRDIMGMSARDYYMENDMLHRTLTGKDLYSGKKFQTQTDYLGMPIEYRPRPMTKINRNPTIVHKSVESAQAPAGASTRPLSVAEKMLVMSDLAKERTPKEAFGMADIATEGITLESITRSENMQ